jgi:hypothetical protein
MASPMTEPANFNINGATNQVSSSEKDDVLQTDVAQTKQHVEDCENFPFVRFRGKIAI